MRIGRHQRLPVGGPPGAAPAAAPPARRFAEAFRKRFGTDPAPYAAGAYDAVHLLARCLRGLDRKNITRQDLVPVLRRTRHQEVSKDDAFEPENGTYVGEGVFSYRVGSGRFRFLGTEPPQE